MLMFLGYIFWWDRKNPSVHTSVHKYCIVSVGRSGDSFGIWVLGETVILCCLSVTIRAWVVRESWSMAFRSWSLIRCVVSVHYFFVSIEFLMRFSYLNVDCLELDDIRWFVFDGFMFVLETINKWMMCIIEYGNVRLSSISGQFFDPPLSHFHTRSSCSHTFCLPCLDILFPKHPILLG